MFASGATGGTIGGRDWAHLPPRGRVGSGHAGPGPAGPGHAGPGPAPRARRGMQVSDRPEPTINWSEVLGTSRRAMGNRGEDEACRYLLDHGALLIDRNWRCCHGEVDIVARSGSALLFCEVRTRRGTSFGTPLESITRAKAARMGRVAQAWLALYGPHCGPIRLDVIGWLLGEHGSVQLNHIKGVQP